MDQPKKQINWTAIILAGLVIFGLVGGYYAYTIQEKNEVSRLKIASDEALELEKLRQQREQAEIKQEQENKEYAANRKNDCLGIYKTESNEWNNVRGWRYNESDDKCYIRFKNNDTETKEECGVHYPVNKDGWKLEFFRENLLCKDGEFENSF
jgi:hypothetical protein